ncbi:MAG: hypothetical protein ACLQIB_11965 [Isosphaeraceae bacterium]
MHRRSPVFRVTSNSGQNKGGGDSMTREARSLGLTNHGQRSGSCAQHVREQDTLDTDTSWYKWTDRDLTGAGDLPVTLIEKARLRSRPIEASWQR